jgi:hypothetical protein
MSGPETKSLKNAKILSDSDSLLEKKQNKPPEEQSVETDNF